jgi:hypothetical protein
MEGKSLFKIVQEQHCKRLFYTVIEYPLIRRVTLTELNLYNSAGLHGSELNDFLAC